MRLPRRKFYISDADQFDAFNDFQQFIDTLPIHTLTPPIMATPPKINYSDIGLFSGSPDQEIDFFLKEIEWTFKDSGVELTPPQYVYALDRRLRGDARKLIVDHFEFKELFERDGYDKATADHISRIESLLRQKYLPPAVKEESPLKLISEL